MICVWDNVLPYEDVTMYYNKINSHFKEHCEKGFDKKEWYPARNIDVTSVTVNKTDSVRISISCNIRYL